ncbi:MAG TPA: D-alanyl-D-alanine carboxypeptidase, partial [Methylibium sp.]
LDGDLLIVGGGDATLTADVLRAWFEELRRLGLREIGGNILLDRGAFRLQPDDFAGTPAPSPRRPEHARPDAFSLRAAVPRLARSRPQQTQLAVHGPEPATSPLRETYGGGVAPGATPNLAELALLAAGPASSRTIAALWARVGGVLRGRVVERKGEPEDGDAMPRDADGERMLPFSVHHSASLAELLRGINKWSDNLAARNLMLTLSEGFPLRAATLPDAKQRLRAWLAEQGLGEDDIAVDSGSGLSRAERGRARALAQLLSHAWHRPGADAFIDSLPVAGVDGTLTHRLQDGEAAGRAFLKTGTLNDARALAGYVQGRSGKRYAVVAIVNDLRARAAVPVLDAFIEWVAHNG